MWAPSSHCHDVMWWCHLGICSAHIHLALAPDIGISLFSNCIHWSAIPVAIRITDIFHTPHFACNRHSTQLFLRKVQHSVLERFVMAMVGKLVGYNIWHVILIKRDNRISLSNKPHHTESKKEELTTSSSSSYLKQNEAEKNNKWKKQPQNFNWIIDFEQMWFGGMSRCSRMLQLASAWHWTPIQSGITNSIKTIETSKSVVGWNDGENSDRR